MKSNHTETGKITIYKITNVVNGKTYIGQTNQLYKRRFVQHWHSAVSGKTKVPLHKAMRHYGKDSFSCEPVIMCEEADANYYEHALVNLYESHVSTGKGYNVANPLDHFRSISTAKGENHGCAKLTEKDINDIRSITDLSHFDVANIYSLDYVTVKRIRYGKSWKHVDNVLPIGSYKKDFKSGETHHACVVSDDIREIIKNDTVTNTEILAKKFGISKTLVVAIRGPQPQISKLREIDDSIAQYVLDNPEVSHSKISKELGIGIATISRIKAGSQFGHLKSNASPEQWEIFYKRQELSTGKKRKSEFKE